MGNLNPLILTRGHKFMAKELKKIEFTLPQSLINDMETISDILECDLNDIAVKSIRAYVGKCKKIDLKSLKEGYGEAAEFNKEYAEMCLSADNQALTVCEEKLSESE